MDERQQDYMHRRFLVNVIVCIYVKAAATQNTFANVLVASNQCQAFKNPPFIKENHFENIHANDLQARACQISAQNKHPTEMALETFCCR